MEQQNTQSENTASGDVLAGLPDLREVPVDKLLAEGLGGTALVKALERLDRGGGENYAAFANAPSQA